MKDLNKLSNLVPHKEIWKLLRGNPMPHAWRKYYGWSLASDDWTYGYAPYQGKNKRWPSDK